MIGELNIGHLNVRGHPLKNNWPWNTPPGQQAVPPSAASTKTRSSSGTKRALPPSSYRASPRSRGGSATCQFCHRSRLWASGSLPPSCWAECRWCLPACAARRASRKMATPSHTVKAWSDPMDYGHEDEENILMRFMGITISTNTPRLPLAEDTGVYSFKVNGWSRSYLSSCVRM